MSTLPMRGLRRRWTAALLAAGVLGAATVVAVVHAVQVQAATQTLTPVADTYVSANQKTATFGTSQSLAAYGTPDVESFLRFALPAPAAGQVLQSATLRIKTTSLASAGSVNSQQVRLAGDGWAEPAVTWNTKPALSTVLGTLTAPTGVSTTYTIALSASALSPSLGASTTLALVGTGTDSFWFTSRESGTVAARPTLSLTFSDAPASDSSPPTAATALTATPTGTTVALGWAAATDDVAVTGYDVHRSASAGFAPTTSTRIETVSGLAFSDAGRPAGPWYYLVVAKDAAGNAGPPSNEVTATVVIPPTASTVSLSPTADAMVHGSNKTTNYGSSTSLSAYGSPDVQSFLRFPLPPAPAGQVLATATLRLQTTTLASAGSANAQQVKSAGDGWVESTVTYNSKPAVGVPVLGTLPGGTLTNRPYTIALSPGQLSPLLGSPVTLAVLGTGTDSFWFNSRETTASVRPLLTLTFTPGTADTSPPTAPTELAATVSPGTVALTWKAATDDIGVTGYHIHRSADPDFVPGPATLVGTRAATDFTDPNRPLGSATYRVIAIDASGNLSAPSDPVTAEVLSVPVTTTMLAFGDVACQPPYTVSATACRQADIADIIRARNPDWVAVLGDLQYQNGTYEQFLGSWDRTFGEFKAKTLPVVGNHEYADPAGGPGKGYFDYFLGPDVQSGDFGSRPDGYYAKAIGSWQFIGLNSECVGDAANGNHPLPGGCGVGSPEYQWLEATLATSPAQCTVVAFHRPRWTTGTHPSFAEMAPLWDLMARYKVELTISGHNHSTEVFKPIGASGNGNPVLDAAGIRSFVSGAGGKGLTPFPTSATPLSSLQARDSTTYGVLQLTLRAGSYDWAYVPVAGQAYTNTGGPTGAFSGSNVSCG